MITSKVICDDTYSNKLWAIVAQGMFTLCEINQMEREMCGYLEWELSVILANFDGQARLSQPRSIPDVLTSDGLEEGPDCSCPRGRFASASLWG